MQISCVEELKLPMDFQMNHVYTQRYLKSLYQW